MAPDKIWVTTSEMTVLLSERRHDYDVAYIRKDALLEWAEKRKKDLIETLNVTESPTVDGVLTGIQDIIDKLNEM